MAPHRDLTALVSMLAAARARLLIQALMVGMASSASIAAALVVAMSLMGLWLGLGRAALNIAYAVGLAALATGSVVTIVWAWRRTPSTVGLARRADEHYGLQDRLSTALEVRAESIEGIDRHGAVSQALIRDASQRSSIVKARELAPYRRPWQSLLLIGVLVIGVPVQYAVVAMSERVEIPASDPELGGEATSSIAATPTVSVEEALRAADLLEREAELSNDAYMRAVARSLRALGARIERGELDSPAATAELDRLVRHARRSLGIEAPQTSGNEAVGVRRGPGDPRGEARPSGVVSDDEGSGPIGDDPRTSSGETGAIGDRSSQAPSTTSDTLDQLLWELEKRVSTRSSTDLGDQGATSGDDTSPVKADEQDAITAESPSGWNEPAEEEELRAREMRDVNRDARDLGEQADPQAQARAEAERAYLEQQLDGQSQQGQRAPAEDAGRGASELAGEGSPSLTTPGEDARSADLADVDFEEVALPQGAEPGAPGSRTLRLGEPGDIDATAPVRGAGTANAATWPHQNEVPVSPSMLSSSDRSVASAYMVALQNATEVRSSSSATDSEIGGP